MNPKMKGRKLLWALKGAVMFMGFVALASLAVMALWNWLLPGLLGLPAISYLQAAGLMLLSRILLGGFRRRGRHGHGHHHWKHRMAHKWAQMTPEEQAQWKERMGHWCHHHKTTQADGTPAQG